MAAHEVLVAEDRIVVEGGPDAIDTFAGAVGLSYADSDRPSKALSGTTVMREVAVPQTARLVGRSASPFASDTAEASFLLGISRSGRKLRDRLRETQIEAGDLLLLLGPRTHSTTSSNGSAACR